MRGARQIASARVGQSVTLGEQSMVIPRECRSRPEMVVPEEGIEVPSRGMSASKQLEHDQERELLRRALMKLPEDKRELLVLARYREMKYEQIAELLAVDVGAVKVRVYRAMKELREIFLKLSGEKLPCNVKRSEINLRII